MKARADRLDREGRGIARCDGLEVVVPGLLPGEQAEVCIEHKSPHEPRAWAHIERRVGDASPDRQAPACPGYGRCGGCALQHMAYPAQLELKHRVVEDALGRPVEPVVPSPAQVGWRNKGKYVVARAGGEVVLGAYAPRSHDVIDTVGCRAVEPEIDALAARLRDRIAAGALAPYDERSRTGDIRYVIVRRGGDGSLLAVLVTTSAAPRSAVQELADAVPDASVVWMRNDSTGGRLLSEHWETVTGAGCVRERIAGVDVAVGPADFFQLNRAQAERLYMRVADRAGAAPGVSAVDVYGGLGGIAFHLAQRGATVVGVESLPSAVDAARRAAASAGLGDRLSFVCAAADQLAAHAAGADAVVVNPPRRGLSEQARGALRTIAAPTVVYVSCNPESLGRDVGDLAGSYELASAEPFDLMPGSPPVEVVATLRRRP